MNLCSHHGGKDVGLKGLNSEGHGGRWFREKNIERCIRKSQREKEDEKLKRDECIESTRQWQPRTRKMTYLQS